MFILISSKLRRHQPLGLKRYGGGTWSPYTYRCGTFIAGGRAIHGTFGPGSFAREFPHWMSLALGQRIITDLGMEIQSPLIHGQVDGN
jgi:hypothetical protein